MFSCLKASGVVVQNACSLVFDSVVNRNVEFGAVSLLGLKNDLPHRHQINFSAFDLLLMFHLNRAYKLSATYLFDAFQSQFSAFSKLRPNSRRFLPLVTNTASPRKL